MKAWFIPSTLAAVGTLLSSIGCVPEIEDDLSAIRQPRLLALQATPAEAKPGDKTTLRALVATPDGVVAPSVDFRLCLARKPLTQLGAVNPACLEVSPDAEAVSELGRGLAVDAELPTDACQKFGPQEPPSESGKPSGRPVDPDVTGGFYQPFVAALDGRRDVGAVRIDCDLTRVARDQSIKFRQQYRRNQNPELSRVEAAELGELDEGVTAKVPAGTTLPLTAGWNACPTTSTCGDGLCTANEEPGTCPEDCTTPVGCTGAEPYVWYDAVSQRVAPRREAVSVAWYASRGRFRAEQTGYDEAESAVKSNTSNTWSVGTDPGPATLWLVIRDSRGGQSWRTFHFEVTP
jgi:hypothetical protein